jgi:hypothetical protein
MKIYLFILVEAIFIASGPIKLVQFHNLYRHPNDFLQGAQEEAPLVEGGETGVQGGEGTVEEEHIGDFMRTNSFRIMHPQWIITIWEWK